MEVLPKEGSSIEVKKQNNFSKVNEANPEIDKSLEKVIFNKEIPGNEVIGEISTMNLSLDLALASVAKKGALKIIKMENFLSKIEDELFTEENLENLDIVELMQMYQLVRISRNETIKNIKEIRQDVNFENLEASILSMNNKQQLTDISNGEIKGLLQGLLENPTIVEQIKKKQREKLIHKE
jgi:hypothetical protein